MTLQQEAEKAWEYNSLRAVKFAGSYLKGISDFKSSLRKEIEKEIEHYSKEQEQARADGDMDGEHFFSQIIRSRNHFLTLLDTCKPI